MSRLQKTILLLCSTFLVVSVSMPVSAGLLDQSQFEDPCDVCEFARLLSGIKNLVLEIGAAIAVLFIIIGGVMYMGVGGTTGSGNKASTSTAKKIITSAIIGLVILVIAWLIVSAIMAATLGGNAWANWWTIKCPDDTKCVYQAPATPTPSTTPTTGGGSLTGDRTGASGALSSFLSCLESKVPEGKTWRITSVTEYAAHGNDPRCVENGGNPLNCSLEECKKCDTGYPNSGRCPNSKGTCGECNNLCVHGHYSCHYGGRDCPGSSYAVDIGNEADSSELQTAAKACESGAYFKSEGDHYHISIGAAYNCGCN